MEQARTIEIRKAGMPMITSMMLWNEPNNTLRICPQLKDPGPIVQMKDVDTREEIERFLNSLRPVAKMEIDEQSASGPLVSPAGHPSPKATTTQV